MTKTLRRAVLGLVLLTAGTGCAHTGPGVSREAEAERNHRTRNTLIAVGAAIALGAIVANKAESNSKDIIRDVVHH